MGKTSLLKQVRVAADRRKIVNVLVDLSDVLSVADVAVRLEHAYRALPERLKRVVDRELGGLGITSPLGGVSISRRTAPDPIAIVHSLLEVPARAERSGRRVLLIFDEFQALIDLRGVDGVFRSHLQHHDRVSCIFSGSEPSLLRALFEDRARPLFGQAEQVRLERIPFETAYDFVSKTFGESGKDLGDVPPYEASARAMAGLASSSSAQRAVEALLGRGMLERAEDHALQIVDPLLARWVRLHGGARPRFWVLPSSAGGFVVTDGPSPAFARGEYRALEEAESEAHRLASATGRGADVMIFDTDDPNDLPDWAVGS